MLRDIHMSAPLCRQTEKKKKVSAEFTADPFRADAITPAVGAAKKSIGP